MAQSKRQEAFNNAPAEQIEAYAKRLGFPSAGALSACLAAGAKLKRGEMLDRADVGRLAKHWPAIPAEAVAAYAKEVNAGATPQERVGKLIGVVYSSDASDIKAGLAMVDNFIAENDSMAVLDRLGRRDQPEDAFRKPSRTHPENTLRSQLEASAKWHGSAGKEATKASLPPIVRRTVLADRLEENNARQNQIKYDRNATLRDSLDMAFDKHELTSEAQEELSTVDLPQPLEQDDANV